MGLLVSARFLSVPGSIQNLKNAPIRASGPVRADDYKTIPICANHADYSLEACCSDLGKLD